MKLGNLRYVVSCSVGLDNIDLDEAGKRNIEIINCQGTNANSVAEHTLYLILSLIRRDNKRPFFEIKNKTIGLYGFGNIGKEVAVKLKGFGARVIAYDVIPQDKKILNELNVSTVSLKELAEKSDIVSVHIPLNRHTLGIVGNDFFSGMKEGSFFVNTSRSEVVDEPALIENFKKEKFRGIGLDVYSDYLKKEIINGNVIFTGHVAAQGEDSFREMCVKPVEEFLRRIEKN